MRRFDCLALDCPLWGPHLLEASAGTGKTFSIEHIYVRLLLEAKGEPFQIEQILAVTFTKAATRELKGRIRSALEKALQLLGEPEKKGGWEYLIPHQGSSESMQRLADALFDFESCQIYTIHGFCARMLREYAFEAKLGFSLSDLEKKRGGEDPLQEGVLDFLKWGISSDIVCSEQLLFLLKEGKNLEEIGEKILREEKGPAKFFTELWSECKAVLHRWEGGEIDPELLLEDFRAVRENYKKKGGDFETQVRALATLDDPTSFRKLLASKGTLFEFLHPSQQKVKVRSTQLHYPNFFEWALAHIAPLVQERKKEVLKTLRSAWEQAAGPLLSREESWDFDQILKEMKRDWISLFLKRRSKKNIGE